MNRSLRITVADSHRDMGEFFHGSLPRLGHQLVNFVSTGNELIETCRTRRPDLVIADANMPDMDSVDAVQSLCRDAPLPVILMTAPHDGAAVRRAQALPILACLSKPLSRESLDAAIHLAMLRFEEMQSLRHEVETLRRTLEDRKILERAKGIVMRRLGVDEEQAYRRMTELSSRNNWKLAELCRHVLQCDEIFQKLSSN
jgi:response regulator NasT